jgi:hypothetical protein
MNISEFAANYSHLGDDQLLYLWADRNTLVPEVATALESEIQRRGLKKESAERHKKRLDTLAALKERGPQVATAKYERNMRHFVEWQEPEFHSPYGRRDIRRTYAGFRHRYRVWDTFRNHTGHWPVFSISFYCLSWTVIFGFAITASIWVEARKAGTWTKVALLGGLLILIGARELGARMMRKLDWRRFGS